ncbi:MAG: hypothetical protein QOK15_2545 [Nocardioidaceae bacterium]|nr:hypothetical protein [Nocardioidaceae bacterium]
MAGPRDIDCALGRARRRRSSVPRDLRWTMGRRLILVDIENVIGGECSTEARARWAHRRIEDEIGGLPTDCVVVAVDASGLTSVGWEWDRARRLIGYGENGADLALLDVLNENVDRRFERVVIASGDGIFTEPTVELTGRGVDVTVVAHECALSGRLRLAASRVVLLSRVGDAGPGDVPAQRTA